MTNFDEEPGSSEPSVFHTNNDITSNNYHSQPGSVSPQPQSTSSSTDKPKKSVGFRDSLRVILIPTRHEYKDAGLNSDLWWTNAEFKYFQQLSTSEILYMADTENLDLRSARRKLYQPSLDEHAFAAVQAHSELEMVRLNLIPPASLQHSFSPTGGSSNGNNNVVNININTPKHLLAQGQTMNVAVLSTGSRCLQQLGTSSPRRCVKAPTFQLKLNDSVDSFSSSDDSGCDSSDSETSTSASASATGSGVTGMVRSRVSCSHLENGEAGNGQFSSRKASLGLYPVSSLQQLHMHANDLSSLCHTDSLDIASSASSTSASSTVDCMPYGNTVFLDDESDPLLFIESDCLSLCVPLDVEYEVEFEKTTFGRKGMYRVNSRLAQYIQYYVPSPMAAVLIISTILMLIFIVLVSTSVRADEVE